MYRNLKDISKIAFPVYPIRSEEWYRQDGILFIDDGKILDNKNMPGATLGVRRIQCSRKPEHYRIKKVYPDFKSMIQSKKNKFIDSRGRPFIYQKKYYCHLKSHKVKRIERRVEYTIIWLIGIPYPFKLPRPPYGDAGWARVLYFKGSPWILYDFTNMPSKNSYRRA